MTAALTAQKAHIQDNADGIILASSDSDFFSLIECLREVKFMVLAERDKISNTAIDEYEKTGVFVCMIDDFTSHLGDIQKGALNVGVSNYLTDHLNVNLNELLDEMYQKLRLDYSTKEKAKIRDNMIRNLKVQVDIDGELSIKVSE